MLRRRGFAIPMLRRISAWCILCWALGGVASADRMQLAGQTITNWGYQLQNDDPRTIANSPYDVVVIDYSRDGGKTGIFTAADLAIMKRKPDGSRRIVLSYVSIGEAEDYRYYWTDRGWNRRANRAHIVDNENPEWRHNYSVRYWLPEWQDIIVNDTDSYINRVSLAGFDGVYLDKIDVSDDYDGKTPDGTVASDLMIQFVRKISVVMKQRNPAFQIIAQNAEGLLDDDEYRAAVDGIGKEDLLYHEEQVDGSDVYQDGVANTPAGISESVRLLNKLRRDGKTVMAVEYLKTQSAIDAAAERISGFGYLYYFGPRDLSRLAPPIVVASAARTPAPSVRGSPPRQPPPQPDTTNSDDSED